MFWFVVRYNSAISTCWSDPRASLAGDNRLGPTRKIDSRHRPVHGLEGGEGRVD